MQTVSTIDPDIAKSVLHHQSSSHPGPIERGSIGIGSLSGAGELLIYRHLMLIAQCCHDVRASRFIGRRSYLEP
jgi:hypothetical protein